MTSAADLQPCPLEQPPRGPSGAPGAAPLLVIGAGPKAVALAAKAKVLRDVGIDAPEVVAIERDRVAANWRPGGGWTNGRQPLGTLPEKDLGFPYDCTAWGGPQDPYTRRIAQRMTDFAWASHLLARGAYARWIDRGRPQPSHQEWADYLEWAAREAGLRIITGDAVQAELHPSGWELTVVDGVARRTVHGCGLLVSGPGPTRGGPLAPDGERILCTADFWRLAVPALPAEVRHVTVVGAGETAGTITRELAVAQGRDVTVFTPAATLYSRGESPFENHSYTDPAGWQSLSEADRREFIRRTDRAVFSQDVQRDLATTDRVSWRPGRVTGARRTDDGTVAVTVGYAGRRTEHSTDLVVDATGGDPLWFTGLLGPRAAEALGTALGAAVTRDALERSIGHTLSVTGLPSPLHLPNLAGFAQGPGFPNLSSLGLLSDRVLRAYAASGARRTDATPPFGPRRATAQPVLSPLGENR